MVRVRKLVSSTLLPSALALVGCQTAQPLPSDITLKDALVQVREGIRVLQERDQDSKPAGLLISEVTVTFNVTASRRDSAKLGLDLALGAAAPSGRAEFGSDAERSRSNQITFKFQNLFLAPKDSLAAISVTPATLTAESSSEISKDKDKTLNTSKLPRLAQPLTLKELYDLINESILVTGPQ